MKDLIADKLIPLLLKTSCFYQTQNVIMLAEAWNNSARWGGAYTPKLVGPLELVDHYAPLGLNTFFSYVIAYVVLAIHIRYFCDIRLVIQFIFVSFK